MEMRNCSDGSQRAPVGAVSPYFDMGKVQSRKKRKMEKEKFQPPVRVVSPYFNVGKVQSSPFPRSTLLEQEKIASLEDIWNKYKYEKFQQKRVFKETTSLPVPTSKGVIRSERKHEKFGQKRVKEVRQTEKLEVKPLTSRKRESYARSTEKVNAKPSKSRKKKSNGRSITLSAGQKRDDAYRKKSIEDSWKAPRSIYSLLQENHAHDPWRVLIICMLLNCTTGHQVHFFSSYFPLVSISSLNV